MCIPEIRGTAFAVFALSDDIGKGLGPALVVLLINAYDGRRRPAFNIVVLFWLFCGAVLTSLAWTVLEDEERVHRRVKESLLKQSAELLHDMEQSHERPLMPSKRDLLSPQTAYCRILGDVPSFAATTEVLCASAGVSASVSVLNPLYQVCGDYFQSSEAQRRSDSI